MVSEHRVTDFEAKRDTDIMTEMGAQLEIIESVSKNIRGTVYINL